MLVVSIDLHPWGSPPRGDEDRLAQVLIGNDGSGTQDRGNYEVWLLEGEERTNPHLAHQTRDPDVCVPSVERFPDQRHVLNLVAIALCDLVDEGLQGRVVA